MAVVTPPSPANVDSKSLQSWFTIFRPEWDLLAALGYIEGCEVRGWSQELSSFSSSDGKVVFMGDSDHLDTLQELLQGAGDDVYAVSTDAADTGSIALLGVDPNGDAITAYATLNGTTPVQVETGTGTGKWKHVNTAFYVSGSVGTQNAGHIYVSTKATAGTPLPGTDKVQIIIQPEHNVGYCGRVMCPNNEAFVFPQMNITADQSDGARIELYISRSIGGGTRVRFQGGFWNLYENAFQVNFATPIVLGEGDYIEVCAERNTGVNIDVTCNMKYYSLSQDTDPTQQGTSVLF